MAQTHAPDAGKAKDDITWSELGLFALGALVGALAGLWAVSHMAAAMAVQAPGFWFVSRSAGIVSYLLLWLATAWGISLSSKGVTGLVPAPLAYTLHNVMSWLALGFGAVHAVSLLGDRVVPFTAAEVLVPFLASYKPLLTGLGTLSAYIGLLVSVTFYWKRWIGHRAWRVIHMLSYGMFLMVTIHGVLVGTDTPNVLVQGMYIAAAGSVLFLTLFRILTARGARQPELAPVRSSSRGA